MISTGIRKLGAIVIAGMLAILVGLSGSFVEAQMPPVEHRPQETKSRGMEGKSMQYWYEFELLKYITGRPYAMERNRLLQPPIGLENRLIPYAADQDWQTKITAHILLGYLRHQSAIATVLRNLNEEKVGRAQASAAGMSPVYEKYRALAKDLGPAVLPFAWEMLLKFDGEAEDWKLIAMTHIIGAVPHPLSAEALIRFIESTRKKGPRSAAVATLIRIADTGVIARVTRARAHHEAVADVLREMGEEVEAQKSGRKSGSEKGR
ncbi:MAG: hypothetical protein FJ117_02200 [Deltaproteobacteria bacterium]|nr:hypothetical protein [Deltaproteobacteria bacterium]